MNLKTPKISIIIAKVNRKLFLMNNLDLIKNAIILPTYFAKVIKHNLF